MARLHLIKELRRRNMLRAAALYIAAAWALAQGVAQLLPVFDIQQWVVRWFVLAASLGLPFWLAFAWFYEFTPQGWKRENEVDPTESIARRTGKQLDRWIIAALAVAVVLLLTDRFVLHHDANTAAAIPGQSIAVLPLANESNDQNQQYFSDGLSEDLITALSQFSGLKVISRNSSFQFRDAKEDAKTIGAKLGVAHLLEGSVRRAGDKVRINAELVNVADGSTLWSQRYDRPYQDLFKLQDDITSAVAVALRTKLLGTGGSGVVQSERPPSGNLLAYNAYLQGNYHLSKHSLGDLQQAVGFYRHAIELDPRYALAWAKLSLALGAQGNRAGGAEAVASYIRARAAAQQALALNANLGMAHYALGSLMMTADWNFPGAQAQFLLAQAQTSDAAADNGLAAVLASLGQLDAAVQMQRKAIARDPLQTAYQLNLVIYLIPLHRYAEAIETAHATLALQPSKPAVHVLLAIIAIEQGDPKRAQEQARQELDPAWKAYALALAQQATGDRAAADAALKVLIDAHAEDSPFQIAAVYASRGDGDQAFAWLERAWAAHDSGVTQLLFDPFLSKLKGDPRFAAFCRKVGLPVPTRSAASGISL